MVMSPAPSLQTFDPRRLRNVLGSFTTGVVIVTSVGDEGRPIGLTVNSFNSVSMQPPLILWNSRPKISQPQEGNQARGDQQLDPIKRVEFDGVIDFDAIEARRKNPADPKHIKAEYDKGDHLHPNDAGYAPRMAQGIDLQHTTASNKSSRAPSKATVPLFDPAFPGA